MILTIDAGNSNLKIAIFDDNANKLLFFKIKTKQENSADSLFDALKAKLKEKGLSIASIKFASFSSVVPDLISKVEELLNKMQVPYKQLNASVDLGLSVAGKRPVQMGSDILANLYASQQLYPNCDKVIISFGTALTFCALREDGEILGCAFSAGLGTSFRSLIKDAALLNDFQLFEPKSVFGLDTETALSSGFIFGFQGMVTKIAQDMQNAFANPDNVKFIITGYEAKIVNPKLENSVYNMDITLMGLYLLAKQYAL